MGKMGKWGETEISADISRFFGQRRWWMQAKSRQTTMMTGCTHGDD